MYRNQIDRPQLEKDAVLRRLRSNLSKLTMETMDSVVKKLIKECVHYSVLLELSLMIIEKASFEGKFSSVYAMACHGMKKVSVPVKLWTRNDVGLEDTTKFPLMLSLCGTSEHQSPLECSQHRTVPVLLPDILCHIAHFLWRDYFDLAPLLLVCSDWNKAIKEMASNPRKLSFKKVMVISLNHHLEHHFSKPMETNLSSSNPNSSEEQQKLHFQKLYRISLLSFVGELFLLDMIKKKLLEKVSQHLLQQTTDIDLELLLTLLSITGKKWEEENEGDLDIIFSTLQNISKRPVIPIRIRFIIVELIELRSAKWPVKRQRRIL